MKIIYNNNILDTIGFLRYINGITLYPFIILREKERSNEVLLNHEKIHIEQQKELFVIFFYLMYVLEFIFKGFSYYRISFEKEAYKYQKDLDYLIKRKKYSFVKHI